MASSNFSNKNYKNFRSKKFKFNSALSRSKNSSKILKEMPRYLQLMSKNSGKKWYDVTVVNSKNTSKTIKKPRSNIPIEFKNKCQETSCCIRITNLSRRVTADCLHQIFSEFGTIQKLDLHFNIYDRISRGFSYIMFSTSEESENAVRNMNKCEIDGHEIICEQWFLPYIEFRVSSILRGACSAVGYQRKSFRCISPTYNTQRSSQLDGLSFHSGAPFNSLMPHNYLPTNNSFSGTSRRSYFRSQRQSRLRSRSKYQNIQDSMHLNSLHSKSSKKSRNIYSRLY